MTASQWAGDAQEPQATQLRLRLADVERQLKHLRKARLNLQYAVDAARSSGATWADIGRAVGTTKQNAQKRFLPMPRRRPGVTATTDPRLMAPTYLDTA